MKALVATFNEAEAIKLLAELRDLLAVADQAFQGEEAFAFPKELLRLPAVVSSLQSFLGRDKPVRVPFWNCVKALDGRRKKLGLIATLEAMVDRATSMQPSPMVTLLQAESQGKLSTEEQAALRELDEHLGSGVEEPPSNLRACRLLFARVPSPAYAKLLKRLPRTILDEPVKDVMDYAAYLDFCCQNSAWTGRHMAALEDLYGFLLQFDYDPFYQQLNRVLFGRTPTAAEVTAGHARFKAKERQQTRRGRSKKQGSSPTGGPTAV